MTRARIVPVPALGRTGQDYRLDLWSVREQWEEEDTYRSREHAERKVGNLGAELEGDALSLAEDDPRDNGPIVTPRSAQEPTEVAIEWEQVAIEWERRARAAEATLETLRNAGWTFTGRGA